MPRRCYYPTFTSYKIQNTVKRFNPNFIELYKFQYLMEPLNLRSVIKGVLIFSFLDLIKHVLYNSDQHITRHVKTGCQESRHSNLVTPSYSFVKHKIHQYRQADGVCMWMHFIPLLIVYSNKTIIVVCVLIWY